MGWGVGVNFTADIWNVNFSIDNSFSVSKKEIDNISNLEISWYNEWTFNIDNYYNNLGEDTPYNIFFKENIDITFDKEYLEEWINVAKESVIKKELWDYIDDYLMKKYNLIYLSRYGYLDKTKYKKVEELENQANIYNVNYDEYKLKLDKLINEAKLNDDEIDEQFEQETKEIIDYILPYLKFISFDGEVDGYLTVDNMFWSWYVRWELSPNVSNLEVDNNDINISWLSYFYFELDNNDELIYKIYNKDNLEFSIDADSVYNLLEEKKEKNKIEAPIDINDIFDITISFTMTNKFVDFYYNTFWNDEFDE